MIQRILDYIAGLPRASLGVWPTPFLPLYNLRKALGPRCPSIWMKREDMTPLGAGGNKIRKLEFVLGKAVMQGCDVLLNTGEVQSNQVVQTAAAAAHLGIPCELFIERSSPPYSEDDHETGNILLCRILGARIHMVPTGQSCAAAMREREAQLLREGHTPCVIPRGASSFEGMFGSILCLLEIMEQAKAHNITPTGIAVTVGSAGTASGFLVALRALELTYGLRIKLYAYDSFGPLYPVQAKERIMHHAEDFWQQLQLPGACGDDLLMLSTDFVGPGYCRPYAGMVDAVRLVAQTEGVILDPNYTGKSMAGLLHAIRANDFAPTDNIVFFHSGGMPALFAMRRHFA